MDGPPFQNPKYATAYIPIFKLSAPRNNASVEWSYFAQKCIKFYLQPSRFEKFTPGEKPQTPATWAGMEKEGKEGVKVFLLLKRGGKKGQKGGKVGESR